MNYRNNPLNLRYSKRNNWRGQIEPRRGFCQFSDVVFGVRAALITICRSYRRSGVRSIAQLVNRYAPPSENNTQIYITYLCGCLDALPQDDFLCRGAFDLLKAMCRIESGYKLTYNTYKSALSLTNLQDHEITHQ